MVWETIASTLHLTPRAKRSKSREPLDLDYPTSCSSGCPHNLRTQRENSLHSTFLRFEQTFQTPDFNHPRVVDKEDMVNRSLWELYYVLNGSKHPRTLELEESHWSIILEAASVAACSAQSDQVSEEIMGVVNELQELHRSVDERRVSVPTSDSDGPLFALESGATAREERWFEELSKDLNAVAGDESKVDDDPVGSALRRLEGKESER